MTPVSSGRRSEPTTAVTLLSVVGCSGHPIMKMTLKGLVPDRYRASVSDGGARIKLAGHLAFTGRNLARFEQHDIRAVLVVRDPRDNLVNLVNRSRFDYCPEKFERPHTHRDAVEYHRLIKADAGRPRNRGFVDHYVDGIGAARTLRSIFEVARWHGHPRVHTVRLEDLVGLGGAGHAAQRSTLAALAGFLGIEISPEAAEQIIATADRWIEQKSERRSERHLPWREVFSAKDRAAFKCHFGDVLIRLGYESDDRW